MLRVLFVVCCLLLTRLPRSIAGVHSPYHHMRDDPELKENYSLKHAADAAGFYNDLMLDAFARENQEVCFLHSAPGTNRYYIALCVFIVL
jgi:hypothetical protein